MSDSSCIETAAWDLRCRSLLFPVIDEKHDPKTNIGPKNGGFGR